MLVAKKVVWNLRKKCIERKKVVEERGGQNWPILTVCFCQHACTNDLLVLVTLQTWTDVSSGTKNSKRGQKKYFWL